MSTAELIEKFEKLSPDAQSKIEQEVTKLFENEKSTETLKPRAKFGELKGVVSYISDDFDAPLEDFKDYM